MVGRTIGKYRILEQIGRGGMGTVFKAVDETLGRDVAIKVLNADVIEPDAIERFRREALTLARLNHPRIGAIHELTRDGQDLLMVMEFLVGDNLERAIERSSSLPIPQAVRICTQVLDALIYAHRAGVIHRDLKPANITITPSGDVKVMDFGIARVQGSEHLTTHGFMVGTPAYMAPEQVRGEEVDPRMDLYSMAVVLYRLLTHKLPFSGDTAVAMIHSQLNNAPTPPRNFRADLPGWLDAILTKGLAKAPADRFQSAGEFKAALERGLAGRPTPLRSPDLDETMGPTPTPREMRVPTGRTPMPGPVTASTPTDAPVPPPVTASTPAPAPMSPPVVPAAAHTPIPATVNATVTLRTPHLATAAIILTVLIGGIGALAVLVIFRPAPTEQPVSTSTAATPAAAPAAAPIESPATPAKPPSATPAATAPATPETPPATAASSPQPAQRPPAAAASAVPAPAGGTPRGGGNARGTTPPARPAGAARPADTTTDAAAAPAAADAPAETFDDVRLLLVEGDKSRQVDVLFSLAPGRLEVRAPGNNAILRAIDYRSMNASTYVRGRRPRGQSGENVAAVPDNVGGSGLFGGARHWLTLQTKGEFLIVRLEDRNVIRILMGLEARTGSKVTRQ